MKKIKYFILASLFCNILSGQSFSDFKLSFTTLELSYESSPTYIEFSKVVEDEDFFDNLNLNKQVKNVVVYVDADSKNNQDLIQLAKLSNVKFVRIQKIGNYSKLNLLNQLNMMPSLEGIQLDSFDFNVEELEKLNVIIEKVKKIIIPFNAQFPKSIKKLDNLFEIGFVDEGRKSTEIGFLKNNILAPNLSTIALHNTVNLSIIDAIKKQYHIEKLHLNNVYINDEKIISSIGKFNKLKTLYIADRVMAHTNFNSLINIENLGLMMTLNANKIHLDSIKNLTNLKSLALANFQELKASDSILNLNDLELLKINSCNINQGTINKLQLLKNLENLDLSNNRLITIPENISNIKKLKYLNLSNNSIGLLDRSIGRLGNIVELDVSSNELTMVSDSISNLKHLKVLKLSKNKLTSLPVGIGYVDSLEDLIVEFNDLVALPQSMEKMKVLKQLSLKWNNLYSLPNIFGNMGNLDYLNLSCNSISSLPPSFGNLNNIKYLNLATNDLTTLPKEIGGFKNLEVFLLFERIMEVPFGTNKYTNKYNRISSFNVDTFAFENIQFLDFTNQQNGQEVMNKLWKKKLNFDHIIFNIHGPLPKSNWANKHGKMLNLGYVIGDIPDSLFYNNIETINLSVDFNNQLKDIILKSNESKAYFKFLLNKISFDELKTQKGILEFILSQRRITHYDYSLAFKLDSIKTLELINRIDYIQALKSQRMYPKALSIIEAIIKEQQAKQTYSNDEITDLILEAKSICNLTNLSDKVINYTILLDSLYTLNYALEIATHYLNNGERKKAVKYINRYIDELKYVAKNDEFNPGNVLDQFEAYYLINDNKSMDSLTFLLANKNLGKYESVFIYLKLVRYAGELDKSSSEFVKLKSLSADYHIFNRPWNCGIIETAKKRKSEKEQANLTLLNEIMCQISSDLNFESSVPRHQPYEHLKSK